MKPKFDLTIAIGVILVVAGTVQAQDAAFDIQSGTNTQSGFTAVSSFPASDDPVTLSVDTTPSGFRDRGVTGAISGDPDVDILRDLAFWSTSDQITFTFSGLQANAEYTATAWVFDSASGNSGKNIDFTTGGGTVSITTDNTDASNSVLALEPFTSSGTGTATIMMDHTGGAGGAVAFVNGFQLSVIHPEGTVIIIK